MAFLGLLRGRGAGTVPPEPERRQRLVDAGVESAAVTWDLAVPVCCRQSTKQSLAGHGVRDRRLDRRLVYSGFSFLMASTSAAAGSARVRYGDVIVTADIDAPAQPRMPCARRRHPI
jgi:hypothetical protein